MPSQMDATYWPETKKKFTKIFASKTQSEWVEIFKNTDACCTPVLEFSVEDNHGSEYAADPQPAPLLSRTPALQIPKNDAGVLEPGLHTKAILKEFGLNNDEIQALIKKRAVKANDDIKSSL